MIHRHHLFNTYIILVKHHTGDMLFTPCSMMHPTIKNFVLEQQYNSKNLCANLLEALSVLIYHEVLIYSHNNADNLLTHQPDVNNDITIFMT